MLDRSLFNKLSISYKDHLIDINHPLTSCQQQSYALFLFGRTQFETNNFSDDVGSVVLVQIH